MLLEKRRKRARGAMGVFRAVETARVRRVGREITHTTDSSVEERRTAALVERRPVVAAAASSSPATSLMLTSPSSDSGPPMMMSVRPPPPSAPPASSSESPLTRALDRRVLLSRASRMQALVLDRLRSLDLRRGRRCELLEEILRLKKIMQELQEEVDATTRSVESMERLVRHLTQLSTTHEAHGSSPPRTIENVSRHEALRRMDDAWRSQVSPPRAIKGRDTDREHEAEEHQRRQEEDAHDTTQS